MKVQPILDIINESKEIDLLNEGIMDAIASSVNHTKQYFANINQGLDAKSNLKQLNGVKTPQNDNIQQATLTLRTNLQSMYQQATQHIKQLVDNSIKKMKASPIVGTYMSRNYYSDYLKYSSILPLFQITTANIKEKMKDVIADRFVGIALTVVTGIPNIDDIKDMADLTAKAIKTSNEVATKWRQLQSMSMSAAA